MDERDHELLKKEDHPEPVIRMFCLECGEEMEQGADFCYRCGSKRNVTVDTTDGHVIVPPGKCPFCGRDNAPDAKFCGTCGKPLGNVNCVRRKTRLETKDYIAIILALFPGAFNIFGLGHIFRKEISRGLMYLGFTAVIMYLKHFSTGMSNSTLIFIEVLGFVIYFKQAWEVMTASYRS